MTARRSPAARDRRCARSSLALHWPVSLALDLQSVGADIDLESFRLLLGLIQVVAEHAHCDRENADDQIQEVAIAGHPVSPSRLLIQALSLVTRWRFS